jgi:hypothetical protein
MYSEYKYDLPEVGFSFDFVQTHTWRRILTLAWGDINLSRA